MSEIDEKLAVLDGELERYEQLLAERKRLRAARATLLGESEAPQLSQDDVAGYLAEHPGSRAGVVAKALGVPLATVSAHLYRGKHTRFVSREDGWHLREDKPRATGVSTAIGFSPRAAIGSPRWRPSFLPTGGHRFSPASWVSDLDVAEALGP